MKFFIRLHLIISAIIVWWCFYSVTLFYCITLFHYNKGKVILLTLDFGIVCDI